MQYLRSYQLGEEVVFPLLTKAGPAGPPAAPDAAPLYRVYEGDGDVVKSGYCSVFEKAELSSRAFQVRFFLGSEFAAGHYTVWVWWLTGAVAYGRLFRFEVVAGGAESGQVIALHSYERPHSDFLVQQRTSGRIYKGRNPRV